MKIHLQKSSISSRTVRMLKFENVNGSTVTINVKDLKRSSITSILCMFSPQRLVVGSSVNGKIVQEENESSMLDTKCKFICEFIPGKNRMFVVNVVSDFRGMKI